MTLRTRGALVALLVLMAPRDAVRSAAEEEESRPTGLTWSGEVRLHAFGLNSDEGFGRTGGALETRIFLDATFPARFRFFAEVGSGNEQGSDDAGIERLYIEYAVPGARELDLTAGWIRVPFGRWQAFTLSRPLFKDRQFFAGSDSYFQLRRTSAGFGVHQASGPMELDLAYVNRAASIEPKLPESGPRDAAGRVGLRFGGFSAGASYLRGFGSDKLGTAVGTVNLADVSSCGLDLEWSRGLFTFGGEAAVVDIDGRRAVGYYVQGAWDLSAAIRGLRLLGKYDVLRESLEARTDSFVRYTIGARYALRRDLDLDIEVDQDAGSRRVAGFGGSHVIVGVRYRF